PAPQGCRSYSNGNRAPGRNGIVETAAYQGTLPWVSGYPGMAPTRDEPMHQAPDPRADVRRANRQPATAGEGRQAPSARWRAAGQDAAFSSPETLAGTGVSVTRFGSDPWLPLIGNIRPAFVSASLRADERIHPAGGRSHPVCERPRRRRCTP